MLRILKQYYPIRNIFFVLGEGVFILLSVFIACFIMGLDHNLSDQWALFKKILLISITCQLCLYYNDLYDINLTSSFMELGIRLFQALGAAAILLAPIYYLFPQFIIAPGVFILSIGLIVILVVAWRFGYKIILDKGLFNQKIILLGSGELSENILKEIRSKRDSGYKVSVRALNQNDSTDDEFENNDQTIIKKGFDGLCSLAKELQISKIVVAMKDKRGVLPLQELLKCRVDGIDILEGNSFYEMLTGKFIVEHLNPGWLIFTKGFRKSTLQMALKRFLDLIMSMMMLALVSPVLLIISILIKVDSRGLVIFSQKRVGKDQTPYRIYKFRSMVDNAEKTCGPVWAKRGDHRITRVGHYIRQWRIDEIPQLWNVLKGNMSLVGPRPERACFVEQLKKQVPYYVQRFTLKPGITGWAQVNYGYGASEQDAVEKLNYDLFYIKNLSTLMDLTIIFKTIKIVLFAKGAR